MPPTLDLGRTTHTKMSTPRINLRRATSYTHDRGPLSSTSSRFNFNHLIFASPPPSPGLPHLIPRPRKSSNIARPSRVFRVLLVCSGIALVLYVAVSSFWPASRPHVTDPGAFAWPAVLGANTRSYEMVSKDRLPRFPTPAIVNRHGNAMWTVSIPPNSHFPLAAEEYVDICAKCREVASRVDQLHRKGRGIGNIGSIGSIGNIGNIGSLGNLPGLGSGSKNGKQKALSAKHFVDVHEAELAGYLAGGVSIATLMNQQAEDSDLVGQPKGGMLDRPVCSRSMTFVLTASDAGLGQTLMLLWMSYALAQSESRPFFIDDTYWAYGKYMDIFAPPPTPDCRPPLRHEMLPCPREARHLVVTAETASEFFVDEGDDTHSAAKVARSFDLARRGYEALYKLNEDDSKRVAERVKQLKDKTVIKKGEEPVGAGVTNRGTIVGVHVRRGDRHPLEFQYRDSYMPLNLYADRAHEVLEARHNKHSAAGQVARSHSLMLVASDDPTVYGTSEFAGATRAQEFIQLASKAAASQQANRDASYMHKFVDETLGWEGGFFSAMFWNLGRPAINSATHSAKSGPSTTEVAVQELPSPETLRLRSLVGRAYMMDLAVLAGASDVVVCAVSATGCRLLAVMMGRDAAQTRGHWVNVDSNYGWWAVDF